MSSRDRLGGIIHAYQKYDPAKFPSPTQPPADVAGAAMEHLLAYGSTRELTDEDLANAIRLDPEQIAGFGPSIDALIEMLLERKRKILETYRTQDALRLARQAVTDHAAGLDVPAKLADRFNEAVRDRQLWDLERLWYAAERRYESFARRLLPLIETLGRQYEVEELDDKYDFTGRTDMDVPQALEVKEELETIDKLLEQLREARENAQLAVVDMEALTQFMDESQMQNIADLQQRIAEYLRQVAENQGLERDRAGNFSVSPKTYRLFQSKLLDRIFSDLQPSKTGRHRADTAGDGAVETQRTRPYEFGDSVANLDLPASLINTMIRQGRDRPLRLHSDDLVVHETRNNPKCATCVILDMSGSMSYGGQYINAKRMALALDGLIRKEYPGDFLQFIEMYTFAKPRHVSEIAELMPKIPTIRDPLVRLKADMADPDVTELMIHPHFTNIQHALQLARLHLATQDTPNRQIILITDGLPTAHFEGSTLFMLYPPDPQTEAATMREGGLCAREGITINMFLIPSWSQSSDDIRFAHRLTESTHGRVIFTAGEDLDRFVIWDYHNHRREVVG